MKKIIKLIKYFEIKVLLLVLIISLLSAFATLLGPLFVGKAISTMSINGVDFPLLMKYLVVLIAIYVLSAVMNYFLTYFSYVLSQKLVCRLRIVAFNKISLLAIKNIDNSSHGKTISLIANDIDNIGEGVFQAITQIFTGIAIILGTIICMLYLNVFLGLLIILITPLSVILSIIISTKSKKYFKRQQENLSNLNALTNEYIENHKVVKIYSYENRTYNEFMDINNSMYDSYKYSMFISAIPNPASRVINNLAYSVVGIFGVISGIPIGIISSFLMYSNQFNKPFMGIANVAPQLAFASASIDRLFDYLEQKDHIEAHAILELADCKGEIEFKNVSFSYIPNKKTLKNISFKVNCGEKIAIVGQTGSGKTTIINLLMRFYDVESGEILLDGQNILNYSKQSLRKNLGMVLQDSYLFQGTVAENISFGKKEATIDEIISVCKRAHCNDFILQMQSGYDTYLNNNCDISEGQKQLLCIARIMLSMPKVLILDEATSSIDTTTELYIQSAFEELMRNRTSIIIAHRLSTIMNADKIIVLDNGEIVEMGNHVALLSQNGVYSQLYNSQLENDSPTK